MSMSIYYNVTQSTPLSENEEKTIENLLAKYSVDDDIEEYMKTGKGLNWESFTFYETDEPKVVLNGSTTLPDNTDEANWIGIQHWCKLLSEIRRLIPNAIWEVQVEDHDIEWNPNDNSYDPSK